MSDGSGRPSSFKTVDTISQEEFAAMKIEERSSSASEEPKEPPPPPKPIMVESHLNPEAAPFFVPAGEK